jgi:hypothetical protein
MFFGAVISATGRCGSPKRPESLPKLSAHFKHIGVKNMRNRNSGSCSHNVAGVLQNGRYVQHFFLLEC